MATGGGGWDHCLLPVESVALIAWGPIYPVWWNSPPPHPNSGQTHEAHTPTPISLWAIVLYLYFSFSHRSTNTVFHTDSPQCLSIPSSISLRFLRISSSSRFPLSLFPAMLLAAYPTAVSDTGQPMTGCVTAFAIMTMTNGQLTQTLTLGFSTVFSQAQIQSCPTHTNTQTACVQYTHILAQLGRARAEAALVGKHRASYCDSARRKPIALKQ